MIEVPVEARAIQDHYDRLSRFYRTFWGDHIHHGYWETPGESPHIAQVRLLEELASLTGVKHGGKVLDVGCGIGGTAVWLAKRYVCSVLGLTLSPVQVRLASGTTARTGLSDRVSFRVHDAGRLEEIPDRFDLIWAIESTEHFQDKRAFIRSAASHLNPGGTLGLCAWVVPDQATSPEQERLARSVCEGMLCPALASVREYRNWMEAGGLKDLRQRDITEHVAPTWDHCIRIANRPEVRLLLKAMDADTRRFVATFDAMREAYRSGAMGYAMLAGTRDSG